MEQRVETLRARFPDGTRVIFQGFGEPDPWSALQVGTVGTTDGVDDMGTLHVRWDNGSSLGMVLLTEEGRPPDRVRVVTT